MPKQRDYVIIETNDSSPENIARLTREARHVHANVEHRRDLDADEFETLIEGALTAKGPLEVKITSKVRVETNVICYFICLGPKNKAQAILDAHMVVWE